MAKTSINGYTGRILTVDLSHWKIESKQLPGTMRKEYLGGKGFGAKILCEQSPPGLDPYDPASPLIFATGPVNGLVLSGAAKLCAVFKSPLTGIWGESQCGGYLAPELKFAGYDVVVVYGKSDKPACVVIENEEARVRDASHLWGKDTFETEEILKKDHGKEFQVLSIGQAGENLVRYACATHAKGRQFGRCGIGALMGSKRLKALAVKGNGEIEIAEPDEFDVFRRELMERAKERLASLTSYGTPNVMAMTNETGTLPTMYWAKGKFEGFENINASAMKNEIVTGNKACFACSVACGKLSAVRKGPYAGTVVEGPEYETLYAFGSLCGNDNLGSIAKANEICDKLGMDTISAGNAIAFAMECRRRDLITEEDAGGEKLVFGNHEAIISILEKIAFRKELGNVLAEGVKKAAAIIGKDAEKFAVHVKGLEPPGYDPRGLKGIALAYAVSCRGACHMRHLAYRPNLTGSHPFGKGKIDRLSYEGQAEMVKEQENFYTIVDSMGLCKFVCLPTIGPILWDEILRLYHLVTGLNLKKAGLVRIATRINNAVQSFNALEGSGKAEDALPERFNKEYVEGQIIENEKFDKMRDEYYRVGKTSSRHRM